MTQNTHNDYYYLLSLLLFLIMLCLPVLSQAQVLTVTTGTDENNVTGNRSLREAVIKANSVLTSGTIYLPEGEYILNIGGIDDDGDIDLNNGSSLSIICTGSTPAKIIAQASLNNRIFEVSNNSKLYLSNLILEGTPASSTNGGCIALNNSQLTIYSSTISKGFLSSISRKGGGIYAINNSKINIQASRVLDNRGGTGLTLNHGGGICVFNSILIISGSLISKNSAITGGQGGGIYASNSTAHIYKSEVTENTTVTGGGAGIYTTNSILIVSGSVFSKNNITGSGKGGGIHAGGGSNVSVYKTDITENTTVNGGGAGVYVEGSNVNIYKTDITENMTVNGGGAGVYAEGSTLIVSASILSKNKVTGNSPITSHGGGIHITGGSNASISQSAIIENEALDGGGIYHTSNNSNMRITNTTISGNISRNDGGGICAYNSTTLSGMLTLRLNHATVTQNNAVRGKGVFIGVITVGLSRLQFETSNSILHGNGDDLFSNNGLPRITVTTASHINLITSANIANVSAFPPSTDPMLQALSVFSGTYIHRLLSGSPMIDAGLGSIGVDQHGAFRTPPPDLGAKEYFTCPVPAVSLGQTIIWLGCYSSDWHDPNNWSTGTTPVSSDIILVPPSPQLALYPLIINSKVACRKIITMSGAKYHLTKTAKIFMR